MKIRICPSKRTQASLVVAVICGFAISVIIKPSPLENQPGLYEEPYTTQTSYKHSSKINLTWLRKRKDLLADPLNVRKVIIFAYMRGGSSIIGETFGSDNAAFYWYEPLDQFYSSYFGYKIWSIPAHITNTLEGLRRIAGEDEAERISQFFANLYSCQFDKLPREMFRHPFMTQARKTRSLQKCFTRQSINACKGLLPSACQGPGINIRDTAGAIQYGCSEHIDEASRRNLTTGYSTDFERHEKCMQNLTSRSKPCLQKRLKKGACTVPDMQVSKVLRLNMETIEHILHKMPDVHIVHYFRDPRAIGMSVQRTQYISFFGKPSKDILMSEIGMLCKKMEKDIQIRKQLNQIYPGAFATLTYEELVIKPELSIPRIYSYLGRKVPKSLWTYLLNALNSQGVKESSFSHRRRNATATAKAWVQTFPKRNLARVNNLCKTVLAEFGYPTDIL